MIGQEIDQQNSSDDYAEVDSLDNLTYTNNVCKIRLAADTVMTGAVTVDNGNSLTIDLNGHTLTAAANSRAFYIRGGALTIEDSIGTGVIQGNGTVNGDGGAIWMSSGDSTNALTLTGGTIRGFTAKYGAGVYMGNGTFQMTGGTIEDNSGFGVWMAAGSAVMSGGSVKGSERYDIYIGSGVALTVKNTQVGGTVLNLGKITGQGSAEFTGTVENSGYAVAEITGCKIHRIEHRFPYKGTIEGSPDEYVYLLGHSWPTAKIPSAAGESISLKVPSYITATMENTLVIPEGVTVTVDLAGKPVSADAETSDIKIINHGTLTLIDSSTGGTLSIPIENDGVLNANGGTVTDEVTNRGKIQATGTPVTQFTGTLVNEEGASVTAGNFTDCTITDNGGTIGGDAILKNPEPDPEQPGAGSEDGGAGAVIAALAVGTAVVGGGILLAHSYIQNNLPEGFAVPETRQELAVVLWNMAGKPEPASQQTYTDVQDEEVLKAVCWAVENELVTPETESTLGADVRVNQLQVIRAMYQTNKRKK